MKKELAIVGIVFVLLAGLLITRSDAQHDWGDDFAMYLQQSKNIYEGINQSENFYLFNPDNREYAPKTYSIGFPLVLSPIWCLDTNKILASKWVLIFCFILTLFFTYFTFREMGKDILLSSVLTSLIGLQFFLMDLERQILADLPLVLWGSILWFIVSKRKPLNYKISIIYAFLFALAYLTKTMGASLLFAFFVNLFFHKNYSNDKKFKVSALVGILFVVLVNGVNALFLQNNYSDSHFLKIIDPQTMMHTIMQNGLTYKNEILAWIGTLGNPKTLYAAKLLSYVWVAMVVYGFMKDINKEMKFEHLFCLGYIPIILVFPNLEQGSRYLIPLIPFFFYFSGVPLDIKSGSVRKAIYVVFSMVIVLQLLSFHKKAKPEQLLAFHPTSLSMYENVKNKTNQSDRILTAKPRLIGWMTERYCGTVKKNATQTQVDSFVRQSRISYILIQKRFDYPVLNQYVEKNSLEWVMKDSAGDYLLYQSLKFKQSQ